MKKRLKPWQLITLSVVAVLFIVATIVLVVFFKDAIFTNNTLAITLLALSALVFAVGGAIAWKFFKKC